MMTSSQFLLTTVLAAVSFLPSARGANSTAPHPHTLESLLLAQLPQWREHRSGALPTVSALLLSFLAASLSSAGGVGGGSLFLPILTVVAGLGLKSAAAFCSFMVTGGAASNVLYNLLLTGEPLINYDIALLFQPSLLLGVSVGVVCNVMFPEWLITVLFALFLAFCTAKTCRAGARIWKAEEVRAVAPPLLGGGEEGDQGREGDEAAAMGFPWKDVAVLVMVWVCFFVLHIVVGDKHGKGMIRIPPCGVAYWLITLSQIPFAMAFTAYIVYIKRKQQVRNDQEDGKANLVKNSMEALPVFVLPLVALVTGALSGLFGIGGGLLLNPVLLQIGVPPQTAAATATFMVLFCASMSMVQFILLGMKGIGEASLYAAVCFVASAVGVAVIERAVRKTGRASLIVFLVAAIMVLSTVSVACFGAVDVWRQYNSGEYMGFKLPC